MLHKIYTLLLGIALAPPAFAQTDSSLARIDRELTAAYLAFTAAPFENNDSLHRVFVSLLKKQLALPATFYHVPDSLSSKIRVTPSPDGRIKFYSWDDRSGGTWHGIWCLAQYAGNGGRIFLRQLNTEKEAELGEYTDSNVYEVHELAEGCDKYYLTFGWGTHGSGMQHKIVRVFRIAEDSLISCPGVFEPAGDPVFEYPRANKMELRYDSKLREISYDDFVLKREEDAPFTAPSGKRISLKWSDGKFLPVKRKKHGR